MQSTLIMLTGGHRITVKGLSPGDVDHQIRDHLDPTRPFSDRSHMLYLQPSDRASNSIIIDPTQVVALVRLTARGEAGGAEKPDLTGSAAIPQPQIHPMLTRQPIPPSVYDGQ